MDDIRLRAGEKLEALHEAAKVATGNGRDRVSAAYDHAFDAIHRLREAGHQLWHNELVAESRVRIANWTEEAVRRVREGALPLSPALLYRDLVALLKDHSELKMSVDRRVLVAGAGSAEGCLLVQLLSDWGAHVTVAAPAHAATVLANLGASEFVKIETANSIAGHTGAECWGVVEREAATRGPWDAALLCAGVGAPPATPPCAVLRASAARHAMLDLRPHALLSDRLPAPIAFLFGASFSLYRLLRWTVGGGRHTDFLESGQHCAAGLQRLCQMVESGELHPVLDKVYGPQDFEDALAHACSDRAVGCTVIRFP